MTKHSNISVLFVEWEKLFWKESSWEPDKLLAILICRCTEKQLIVLTSRSMESLVFHLQFTNHSQQSPLISILVFKTKARRVGVCLSVTESVISVMLRSFAFLLTDWVSGCVSFNNFEVEARIWFLHEINLSYWKGHGRTWLWQRDECLGCGHQRLLFSHIYSKSFIIHWINNCNVIVNSFKGKHFIETGPELF